MALARDYGPEGIRVNALCPGWVDTPMVDPLLQFLSAERGMTTDASSDVTGTTLLADGGQAIVDVATVSFAPR